jgi:hypothetical protein
VKNVAAPHYFYAAQTLAPCKKFDAAPAALTHTRIYRYPKFKTKQNKTKFKTSVAEPEPQGALFWWSRNLTRCSSGSDGSGSELRV